MYVVEDIDSDYMNYHFVKYLKLLHTDGVIAESQEKIVDNCTEFLLP